jgi:hypothetical protein
MDIISCFSEFAQSFPFEPQIQTQITSATKSLSTFLRANIQTLRFHEILKMASFLLKTNEQDPTCCLLVKNLLLSIRADGSTCLNPFAVVRFIVCLRSPLMAQLCPDWE